MNIITDFLHTTIIHITRLTARFKVRAIIMVRAARTGYVNFCGIKMDKKVSIN
ncbi:hypothetical protein KAU09_00330 [Candidatus Parcubacteria bacterium]|nr:hypothetical protein [Candidatus Parcubacteria bacterium]